MCSKVLNGHIILTDTSITTILAPEMTYTPIIMMMVDHKIEDAELTLIGETAFKIGMSRERVREISDQIMEMYAQSCQ